MRVLCKSLIGTNRLYMMTRHFVWLVPLSNLLLFFVGGLLLAAATKACPRPFGWLSPRVHLRFRPDAGPAGRRPSDLSVGLGRSWRRGSRSG